MVKGRRPKIFYGTQAAIAPPTFVFFANDAAASVPAELAGTVEGVSGLDNHTVRTSRAVKPKAAAPHATPSGFGRRFGNAYSSLSAQPA